jgi:hypothetical protein
VEAGCASDGHGAGQTVDREPSRIGPVAMEFFMSLYDPLLTFGADRHPEEASWYMCACRERLGGGCPD